MVEYYFSESNTNGTEVETYSTGDLPYNYAYQSEDVVLSNTELKIISSTDDDGNREYTSTTFFEKK